MTESDDTQAGRLIAVFAIIGLLAAIDLLVDLGEGTTIAHVVVEGVVLILAIGGTVILTWRLIASARTARERARHLETGLLRSREQAEHWRRTARKYLQGLSAEIDRQFRQWKFTAAEKEVALLLLKGFSHKEVAQLRGVSEATARQQARATYSKADVAGRHELAAFFLEDLALPK